MRTAYQQLRNKYRDLGFLEYLYFIIRWRLASFEELEPLILKEGKILDFGCGSGILANLLAFTSDQRQVMGFDICEDKINQAKMVSQDINNVVFTNQEPEDKFDVIVMQDVLHHLSRENQKSTILRLRDRLAEDGVLIIQDIDKKSFPKYLIGWLIDVLSGDRKNVFYRSKGEIINMLESSGFKVKTTREDKIAHVIFIANLC